MKTKIDKEYLDKVKETYRNTKAFLTRISDSDTDNPATLLLRKVTPVDEVEKMQQFVQDCEDNGIQLLFQDEVN